MRTILVTGGTGAIGSVLTDRLLRESDTQVHLVVRAASPAHLDERRAELCRFWHIDERETPRANLFVWSGDVTAERLGLDQATHSRLVGEVTHVVHSAGNVKLNRPVDEARRSAVDSVSHVVSFAHACGAQFEKLDVVSTVGVAGSLPGVVPERAFTEPRAFRNSYEAAKAEAESFILSEMEHGLPVTIHRPSMVVGGSNDGRIISFQVFYHLCEFLSGRRTNGLVPTGGDVRLDIIPVDYVARIIQQSTRRRDGVGRIFHLCSGPSEAPLVDDLAARVHAFFLEHGRSAPRLRPVAADRLIALLTENGPSEESTWARQALPYFLPYLDVPQTFANADTVRFFAPDGITLPAVNSYLGNVLSYYLSQQAATSASPGGRTARGAA